MKSKLILLAAVVCLSFVQAVKYTGWKSSQYMVVDDNGAKKYTKEAFVFYNDKACAFYTEESGLQLFDMVERDNKVVKGKPERMYISTDNVWVVTLKLPYSIEIQKTTGYSRNIILNELKYYNADYNTFVSTYKK